MELGPRLIDVRVPREPEGAVLLLHGGASRRGNVRVSPTQLSVLRMIPIAGRVARAGRGRLAVFRLLNSQRGWNTDHTPVDDAEWALSEVAKRFGEALPVCLIGHSLGGRAALLAVGQPAVRSVVALAPWVYPTDVVAQDDRRILIVHGTQDRIASQSRSLALARTLSRSAEIGYVSVEGGKHAMLRHHAVFDRLAAEFAVTTLLGTPPAGALARIAAGERLVTVSS